MKKTFLLAVLIMVACFLTLSCAKKPMQKVEDTKHPLTQEKSSPKKQELKSDTNDSIQADKNAQDIKELIEGSDVYFGFAKDNLSQESMKKLRRKATILRNNNMHLQIEGHCDERGSVAYNMALGKRRAAEARDYLIIMGVDKSRLSIISYGKGRPLDPGHNEKAWAMNRRDHFVIVTKQSY